MGMKIIQKTKVEHSQAHTNTQIHRNIKMLKNGINADVFFCVECSRNKRRVQSFRLI